MAHSIQLVAGKPEIFDDGDLIALICLMERTLDSRPDEYADLRHLVAGWQRGLEGYGPGTIELDLESVVSTLDAERLATFLDLVKDEIERFGKTVPPVVLNERCKVPGVEFGNYPAPALIAALTRLQTLLR